jgi:hypothetical protein
MRELFRRLNARGVPHLIAAFCLSFVAFWVFFDVAIEIVPGIAVIGTLFGAAAWFFMRGIGRIWTEGQGNE